MKTFSEYINQLQQEINLDTIAKIHHKTNLLTYASTSEDLALTLLLELENFFLANDALIKEKLFYALVACLRESRHKSARREAISLLAHYFDWEEIEWSFWLHGERNPEDIDYMDIAENYCKTKQTPRDDYRQAIKNEYHQFVLRGAE